MPIHMPCKRYHEDLPKSVDVEMLDRFRRLSWFVNFLYRLHLWTNFELPWQHFRWRYKQSIIENTIKFLLTTLFNSRLMSRNIRKLETQNIHIYTNLKNSLLSLISSHYLRSSIYLLFLSPSTLAFHYSPHEKSFSASCQLPVTIFYITISYVIWVSRSRDSPINI